jgi:hypothetical protein
MSALIIRAYYKDGNNLQFRVGNVCASCGVPLPTFIHAGSRYELTFRAADVPQAYRLKAALEELIPFGLEDISGPAQT